MSPGDIGLRKRAGLCCIGTEGRSPSRRHRKVDEASSPISGPHALNSCETGESRSQESKQVSAMINPFARIDPEVAIG